MNYVLVPGAWAGGWIWDEVASRLRQKGHTIYQLTLSGLRNDEDARNVRLSTHVNDVMEYLESKSLNSVVLVGHSYSGVVVGQVSVKTPQLVLHSVFIEAFLPIDGQSLLDVSGLDVAHEKELIEANLGLWPAPTMDELKGQQHLSEEQIALLASRQIDHPGRTVTDPAILANPLSKLCSTFISNKGWLTTSREADLVNALKHESKWDFKSIAGGHWPMLTIPDELSELLHEIHEIYT